MSRQQLVLALSVAAGGALGSVGRFLVGLAIPYRDQGLPLATLLVNVVGCFAIGVIVRWAAATSEAATVLRLFLVTGVCGGFTTFSAFSAETVRMLEGGAVGRALLYVALSVAASLTATALGFLVARAATASVV
ncbi:MAG TPA: fluoride efflux transporter CrcB [Gemmatimonadaceae bacterium]|nr:fluoride efflux transporter CrcB [Gemmatimonadaceae bacterium]